MPKVGGISVKKTINLIEWKEDARIESYHALECED